MTEKMVGKLIHRSGALLFKKYLKNCKEMYSCTFKKNTEKESFYLAVY